MPRPADMRFKEGIERGATPDDPIHDLGHQPPVVTVQRAMLKSCVEQGREEFLGAEMRIENEERKLPRIDAMSGDDAVYR